MRKFGFVAAILLLVSSTTSARAVDITLFKNGYTSLANGQLTGTGIGAETLGNTNAPALFTGLLANTTYSLDFFHNASTGSSDFNFTINAAGTGIQSVSLGGGVHNMVVGFTPGDTTLTLNAAPIIFNANQGQGGSYYVQGLINPVGLGSPAQTVTAIPGIYPVDNLYNPGSGNEDYAFQVSDTFQTSAFTGLSGPSPGIPHSEFAIFSGNEVNPRSELVHFILDTNIPYGIPDNITMPIVNHVSSMGGLHQEFDMRLPIGAAGINFSAFGNYLVTSSDANQPNGNPYAGLSGTNDFVFLPTLRFDGTSNGSGFYWHGPGPGIDNIVSATVAGFVDGNVTPLTLSIQAILPAYVAPPVPAPEPTSLALLGFGVAALAVSRRKRS